MQKLFIIDASGYLYSSYFAIRNMTNSKGESTNALFGFIRSVLKLIKDFHPSHLVAVFDGPRNAKKRIELYSEYKAHRAVMPSDLSYQIHWAQEFCTLIGIPYLNIPEVEADDTMGTVAKWAASEGSATYLCTSDKDLCQLVDEKIFILNTRKDNQIIDRKGVEETYGVSPNQMIDLLAMIGDTSDNVPGLPGIGPKTAAALLQEFGTLDNLLLNVDKVVGDKKREAIKNNVEKVLLSRKLVTIDLSVPIPHHRDFYHWKAPNLDRLKSFYAKMSFNSLIKEIDLLIPQDQKLIETTKTEEQLHYTIVDDEKSLQELVARLSKEKEICFDTQTTDTHSMKAELVGIGFGIKPATAWYVPVNGSLGLKRILEMVKPLFENPQIGFYGHNLKYDFHVLSNYNIQIANICFDTILASYLLNSHIRLHSLDALSLQYFGKVKININELIGKGKHLINMREVDIDKACKYCCEEVDYTCRLKELLEPQLKDRNLLKLFQDIELPLIKVLARMERHGIFLDTKYLKHLSNTVQSQIKQVEEKIFAQAGEEFNLNSPKQLSHILQHKLQIHLPKKTATGFSTNADILDSIRDSHPIIELILNYRTLEKMRSTYLESLPQEIFYQTHRIHCTFNQSVAATGRLSCQDPNLQNIPIRTEEGRKIREAFIPQNPNWSYLAADYSQIELRLLAHLSEDPIMIAAFQNHEDIHASTAAAIFNVPLSQVTKEQRHLSKAVNFGIIYGQQAFGLSKELKIEIKEAALFIETYFKRYKRVKEYLDFCKEEVRKTGRAVTFIGRERCIPEIHSKNGQLRLLAERLAVNSPMQGAAADLIKLAMLAIDKKLAENHLRGYMILQIHDELIFEVPDDEIERFIPLVKECMQNVFQLKVPLIVDISVGKNWKQC